MHGGSLSLTLGGAGLLGVILAHTLWQGQLGMWLMP